MIAGPIHKMIISFGIPAEKVMPTALSKRRSKKKNNLTEIEIKKKRKKRQGGGGGGGHDSLTDREICYMLS